MLYMYLKKLAILLRFCFSLDQWFPTSSIGGRNNLSASRWGDNSNVIPRIVLLEKEGIPDLLEASNGGAVNLADIYAGLPKP